MPDDNVVTEPVEQQPQDTQPEVEQPQVENVETAPVEAEPQPLDPGGKRFSEVYRERMDYAREAEALREENARLRASSQAPPPPPKNEAWYTPDQLQAAVDRGQISPALMADQLAWQRAELKSREDNQRRELAQRHSESLSEINRYIDKIPALTQPGSPELVKVGRAATEIARDMGLDAKDLRVQKLALKQVYGSVDKVVAKVANREASRVNADVHAETSPGGTTTQPKADPFKNVPQYMIDHWDRIKTPMKQRLEELKYVKPPRRPTR